MKDGTEFHWIEGLEGIQRAEIERAWKKLISDSQMAPQISATRMVDEFGFPQPKKAEISLEDLELTKRFLSNLKDQTLSRGVFKVLEDLLGRLP